MIRLAILTCLAAMLLAGCQKGSTPAADEIKPTPAAPSAQAGAPAGDPAGQLVTETALDEMDVKSTEEPETKVKGDAIPTPEDYEEEAAKKVTVANLEAELEAMEEELGGKN